MLLSITCVENSDGTPSFSLGTALLCEQRTPKQMTTELSLALLFWKELLVWEISYWMDALSATCACSLVSFENPLLLCLPNITSCTLFSLTQGLTKVGPVPWAHVTGLSHCMLHTLPVWRFPSVLSSSSLIISFTGSNLFLRSSSEFKFS